MIIINKQELFTYRGISRSEEDSKRRTEVDILITKSYQYPASGTPQFVVQYRVQYGVIILYILN